VKQGHLLDKKVERIAFRRVRIVEEELVDQEGLTFLFEVNNIRIFCGGWAAFLGLQFYR
jgi:beta-mannosidase